MVEAGAGGIGEDGGATDTEEMDGASSEERIRQWVVKVLEEHSRLHGPEMQKIEKEMCVNSFC